MSLGVSKFVELRLEFLPLHWWWKCAQYWLPLSSKSILHHYAWNGSCKHFSFISWHHVKFVNRVQKTHPAGRSFSSWFRCAVLSFLFLWFWVILLQNSQWRGRPEASVVPSSGSFLDHWLPIEPSSILVGGFQVSCVCPSDNCPVNSTVPFAGSFHWRPVMVLCPPALAPDCGLIVA